MTAQCDMRINFAPSTRRCRNPVQPGAYIVSAKDPTQKALCCGTHRSTLYKGSLVNDRFGRQWREAQGAYRVQLTEPVKHTFTDSDGEAVLVNLQDVVHVTDQIKYTTLIVKEGRETRRVAVTEKLNDVRKARTAAGNARAKAKKEMP